MDCCPPTNAPSDAKYSPPQRPQNVKGLLRCSAKKIEQSVEGIEVRMLRFFLTEKVP